MSTQKLAGKTALVTGASKGIGASIARHLAAAGASVAVNYASSKAGADKVVAEIIAAGGKAFAVAGDVSKPEDITRLLADTKAAFGGRLDILVNNAGVYEFAPLEAVTPELFHRQFNINVLGLLLTTQAALPLFPATGGSVINISSIVAKNALPHTSVYSATKAAVDSITRVLSVELGAKKIRVNSINPGMVDTEGARTAGVIESDLHKKVESETPLGRIGQPQDIATAAVFLASDDSAWLSGEAIVIAGGMR
ncbi:MAG: fabG 9 [Rariglobus sp.]|jgi:3-oxoacyl-[acyl-carrier protein] reductase|nr:fabG 9 [Rariglobus sp.]